MRTKKMLRKKYQTQHAKKYVWKTLIFFYSETLNGEQNSCWFWNIDSKIFIICLWNIWEQLLQHQLEKD
jgi:hypothetical protein